MIVSVSMTKEEALAFKALGGSKWLHGAIARATAIEVRKAADQAILKHLGQFSDEDLSSFVEPISGELEVSFAGGQYSVYFEINHNRLSGKKGVALAEALGDALRDMAVEIREA